MQADNLSTALVSQITSYNRVQSYTDTGLEGGGPIIKDKLWFWGAYGYTNPRLQHLHVLSHRRRDDLQSRHGLQVLADGHDQHRAGAGLHDHGARLHDPQELFR